MLFRSNLCTEILEVTSQDETAVCNLGSINLGRLVRDGEFDFERLGEIVQIAVRYLDRVIDITHRAGLACKVARLEPVICVKG